MGAIALGMGRTSAPVMANAKDSGLVSAEVFQSASEILQQVQCFDSHFHLDYTSGCAVLRLISLLCKCARNVLVSSV